jgi:hypothetical protein
VADRLNQELLVVADQASVPVPLLLIWIGCAAGTVPPVAYANCKLVGVTAIVDDGSAITPMLSLPADAMTVSVRKPIKPAGSLTEIAELVQDVTLRTWDVLEPAAVAWTLQLLHCEPKPEPIAALRVTVLPAVTTNPPPLTMGVTVKTSVAILHRSVEV